jgi:hypothetical protein
MSYWLCDRCDEFNNYRYLTIVIVKASNNKSFEADIFVFDAKYKKELSYNFQHISNCSASDWPPNFLIKAAAGPSIVKLMNRSGRSL